MHDNAVILNIHAQLLKEAQIENLENDLWDYIKEDIAPLISKLQSCSEENWDEPHAHSPVVTSLDALQRKYLSVQQI